MRTHRPILLAALCAFITAANASGPATDPVLDADSFTVEDLLRKPQTEPGLHEYLAGVAAAAQLDDRDAQRHLRAAWSTPKVRPAIAGRAMATAANAAFRAGHYGEAADLYDRAISEYAPALDPARRADLEQSRGVALALRGQPEQSSVASGSGTIALATNPLGLTTAPARINDHPELQAVLDTGANLSTLSATAARELGVTPATRDASVGSSTMKAVATHLGIAKTLVFGTATLHNVAFLVIDDAALAPLGPKSRIDVILGYPVLAALGRLTFHQAADGRRTLAVAPSPHAKVPGNLRFDGFSAFVRVKALGMMLPFFVDSGANKTAFEKRFSAEHPEQVTNLPHKTEHVGGGGGVEARDTAFAPSVDVTLGGTTVTLKDMPVELGGNGSDTNYGTVGYDVLWAKGGYTIDFGRLNLSLGGN